MKSKKNKFVSTSIILILLLVVIICGAKVLKNTKSNVLNGAKKSNSNGKFVFIYEVAYGGKYIVKSFFDLPIFQGVVLQNRGYTNKEEEKSETKRIGNRYLVTANALKKLKSIYPNNEYGDKQRLGIEVLEKPNSSKDELIKEVQQWIKENIKADTKKIYSVAIQKLVHFNPHGYKHSLSRIYKNNPEVEIQLIKNLAEIFTNAYYLNFEPNEKINKNENVKGVHNYYNIVVFENEIYECWIKVRETLSGYFMYDFGVIRKLE